MGLFGNRKPKLPSYAGAGLEALLRDPTWASAIGEAGIDPARCEIVLRLAEATVASGGAPESPKPAILFGQGNTLAIAFPAEREVRVEKRDKARADLRTQRSGWFQIHFGPPDGLNGFMFWGAEDNLKLGTPEGERFGEIMTAFLHGRLKARQVVGTPQSLVPSAEPVAVASPAPPAPASDDPEDAVRWKLMSSAHSAIAEMMARYEQCFEKAQLVEKALGVANAEFVNGARQHEISKASFRAHALGQERELEGLLTGLRTATSAARQQWKDLLFLLPAAENDVMRFANWALPRGVDSEMFSFILGNAIFTSTDFGVTREAFWAENDRVIAAINGPGQ